MSISRVIRRLTTMHNKVEKKSIPADSSKSSSKFDFRSQLDLRIIQKIISSSMIIGPPLNNNVLKIALNKKEEKLACIIAS